MSTGAQLVLTHGTSDLQILLRDDAGRRWRALPDKTIVRKFHQWLLEQAEDAEIIDTPPELLDRAAEASFTDWHDDTFCLWLRDGAPDARPERDSQGHLQLILPKIQPTLTQWLAQRSRPQADTGLGALAHALRSTDIQTPPLAAVLVLSTDRGVEEQEPVATFTFLKRWLIRHGVPEAAISETVYLHPLERLESEDSPIAPDIARRIEQALRDFYDRSSQRTLLIASMGGLPQIKPLLAEIAVLLAGDRAQSLFKTEHGVHGLLPRTPIDALRVRRQCLEQVRRGALLDAWAMASAIDGDPNARRWVRPLEQAARLLNSNPVGECVELPALQRIIDHASQAACLLVAIRVESALQTGRWLEAINGSLTFLEAAFHDAIQRWAADALESYDSRRRYMRFRAEPPRILLEAGMGKPALTRWVGQKAAPFAYQANFVGEALSAWDEVLGNPSLRRLRSIIHQPLANCPRARLADYRNYNTHGVMTQDEIDEAIKCFMSADLWAQNIGNPAAVPKPGRAFLGQSIVQDVIASLADLQESAQALYEALLQQLENRLIDPHA